MLILHQSNRLEHLALTLSGLLQHMPLTHALQPETIVIQSQGMRRYLNQFLAHHQGVAANIQFNLPAKLMWQITQQNLGEQSRLSPFSSAVLQWRLLQLFADLDTQSTPSPAAEYLASYLDSRAEARFDLAYILADIFDQYLIYRFDWILAWQQGQLLGLGEDELWQADLWRQLTEQASHQGEHRLQLWQRLQDALPTAKLPERIWVFGITSMAPMYLELFQTLAQYTDVHIFATNPCAKYWGDVLEPEWLLRKQTDLSSADALALQGHPLLASLGKQGRDFFNHFSTTLESDREFQPFAENPHESLLAHVQNDLLHLRSPNKPIEHPSGQTGLNHPLLQDASIVVNSAHSPLRELQILKDHIIGQLNQHRDWHLQDIAVLVPQVDVYLPYLEAIFGHNCPDQQPLAYSVADVKLSRQQPLLQALEQLLTVLGSRFELLDVLPLLDAPALQRRFEWSQSDVAVLHAVVWDLNIRWGVDGDMRRQFGGDDAAFTWMQGLERVVLGWMLPQNSQHQTWYASTPYASEPNQWALLAQFWQLLTQLQQLYHTWQTPADVSTWVARLQDAVTELFHPDDNDAFALQRWQQHLLEWQQQAQLAGFVGTLSFAVVKQHTGNFLEQESQAGFLRGGITICSMVPMRGLPFKMLCLLGMNDGDFPRDTKAPSFDLIYQDAIHHRARQGDRSRRDDDRYLFLECLVNVREQLYLSYVGKDLEKDDALAASTVVYEFVDTLAKMVGASSKDLLEHWVTQHPLQPFSARYFDGSGTLCSYRQDLAAALNLPTERPEAFIDGAYQAQLQDANEAVAPPKLDMAQWLAFWSNPTRRWLQQALLIRPDYIEAAWPEQEPFELEDAAKQTILAQFCEARRQQRALGDVEQQLLQANQLPMGQLAPLYLSGLKEAVLAMPSAWFQAQALPPIEHTYHSAAGDLTFTFAHRTEIGQLLWYNKPPNAPETMRLWLEHLAYCACDTSALPKTTIAANAYKTIQFKHLHPDEARRLLDVSLDYWRQGQQLPLPFFARTSLKAAEKWHSDWVKGKADCDEPSAAAKAIATNTFTNDGPNQFPQIQEEGIQLVYAHIDEDDLPTNSPLFWNIIHDVCLPLYDALVPSTSENDDASS